MILAGGNDQIALMEEIRRYFKNEVEIILVDMSEKVPAFPAGTFFAMALQVCNNQRLFVNLSVL